MASFRRLKPELKKILASDDWEAGLSMLDDVPPRQAVGPLFSMLLHPGVVRWRAVTAMGRVVPAMADQSMEDARVIMRRFIWNMSEESGNLGWGVPESMGEIMAGHKKLAKEYHTILLSYIQELEKDCNYIDYTPLRIGAHWGVARLAQARPDLAEKAEKALIQALPGTPFGCEQGYQEPSPSVQGLSALALGLIKSEKAAGELDAMADNKATLELYWDKELKETTVGGLAREALERIKA